MNRTQRNTVAELILTALRTPAGPATLEALASVLASSAAVEIEREAAVRLEGLVVVDAGAAPQPSARHAPARDSSARARGDPARGPSGVVQATLAPAFAAVRDETRERVRRACMACAAYARMPPLSPAASARQDEATLANAPSSAPGTRAATDPPDLAAVLRRAAALFDARLYFEVHEELEPAWGRARGDTRVTLQGLIQIAVALHHAEHGNLAGARRLLADGRAKVEPQAPEWRGIALAELLEALRRFEAADFGRYEGTPAPRLPMT